MRGWRYDSVRHALAAKGIRTRYNATKLDLYIHNSPEMVKDREAAGFGESQRKMAEEAVARLKKEKKDIVFFERTNPQEWVSVPDTPSFREVFELADDRPYDYMEVPKGGMDPLLVDALERSAGIRTRLYDVDDKETIDVVQDANEEKAEYMRRMSTRVLKDIARERLKKSSESPKIGSFMRKYMVRKIQMESFFDRNPEGSDEVWKSSWNPSKGELPPREKYPFENPGNLLVHGTSMDRAKQIDRQRLAKGGTWTSGYVGGFETAQNWAENSFKDPAVVVAVPWEGGIRTRGYAEKRGGQNPDFFSDTNWITFGQRAKQRKGVDITMPDVRLKEVRIFRPVKREGYDLVNLQEVETEMRTNLPRWLR